jgi:HxlR-like helix-turn-helix
VSTYGQFCPVALGAQIFAERWTPLILRELLMGARRFSDIQRGVPRMSRNLLTVYDVVSRQGELVDRIQLPQGYNLVGFGAGKVVYLSMRDAKGMHLARVRLR